MGRIVISEWMSLDGVFDATLMDQWFNPFHSERRGGLDPRGHRGLRVHALWPDDLPDAGAVLVDAEE